MCKIKELVWKKEDTEYDDAEAVYYTTTPFGHYVSITIYKNDTSHLCKDHKNYFHKCNDLEHGKQIVEQIWKENVKKCLEI
jgi:hypothetical protein